MNDVTRAVSAADDTNTEGQSQGQGQGQHSFAHQHRGDNTAARIAAVPRQDPQFPEAPTLNLSKETMRTTIAEGDEIVGDLKVKAGIQVFGTVRGSINCEDGSVYVDVKGHVTGNIESKGNIFVNGKVGEEGQTDKVKVQTPGLVTMLNDSEVNADVFYGRLATYGEMGINGLLTKIPATTR